MAGGKHLATLGTAFHVYMQRWVTLQGDTDVAALAETHQVDVDELRMLCRWGKGVWRSMSRFFPDPICEASMAHGLLTGSCDVLSKTPTQVRIADWKTGWSDTDHEQQLRGYCWLAMQRHEDAIDAYATVLKIRTRKCVGYLWAREELDAWYLKLAEDLKDQTYVPGGHCRYCPRSLECPAKELALRQAISAFLPNGITPEEAASRALELLPKDRVGRGSSLAFLVERMRNLATALEVYDAAVKADVACHGGRLPTADGRALVLGEQVRHPLDSEKAIAIVEQFPSAADWRKACRLSKTELIRIIKAPRGYKKGEIARIMDALQAGGAILTDVITQLKLERDDERSDGHDNAE